MNLNTNTKFTATITDKEVRLGCSLLKAFLMGDITPPRSVLAQFYDREMWEECDMCTYFARNRSVVECWVEFVPADDPSAWVYRSKKGMLWADYLEYCADGTYYHHREIWPLESVLKFSATLSK